MAWPWKYAVRVLGPDGTGISFLPNPENDDDARRIVRANDAADRRRETIGLYRIACIIDELKDKGVNEVDVVRGRVGRFMYIVTGADADKKQHADIFGAENVPAAMTAARGRKWNSIRLYQCEEVPLTEHVG